MKFSWLIPSWERMLAQRARQHHALLIQGPAGIGKSAFAVELVAAWLCEAALPDGAACGRCAACGWLAQGNHPDFRLLTPASLEADGEAPGEAEASDTAAAKAGAKASRDIRIDQVRLLERFVSVGGHRGGCKVVLVDPADALNAAAANALLKTLEEPSGATRFVLVTDRPDALPATVRSRCASLVLPMPDRDVAIAWLVGETGVEPALASSWLAAAGGAPLHARQFAEPAKSATHRLIVETLAGLPETPLVQAADALASLEPAQWLEALQRWVADLQRVCVGAGPRFFPGQAGRLHTLADASSLQALDRLATQLAGLARAVDHPLNPRLMVEDALLRLRAAFAVRG